MKMIQPRILTPLLFGVVAAANIACSRHDQNANSKRVATAPAYVAVARGRIDIEGGLLQLNSAQPGIVDAVLGHPGEHVRRGQPLMKLQSRDAEIAVEIAAGQMVEAQANVQLVAAKLEDARRRASALSEAAAAGADAGQNASDADGLAKQLAAQQAAAMAAVTVAQGQLDRARRILEQHTLYAPVSGDVLEVQAHLGQTVSPQSGPMFTLMPDKPHVIVAEINSEYAGAVQTGMRAVVVLDNDAEPMVGKAHIIRVGKLYGGSKLEEDPATRANMRTLECVLHFDTPTTSRIGQRVLVRILPAKDQHTATQSR